MSQAEHPDRLKADHTVTVEDVRQLMGASTPHFALQLRERIRKLIRRGARPHSRAGIDAVAEPRARPPRRSRSALTVAPGGIRASGGETRQRLDRNYVWT